MYKLYIPVIIFTLIILSYITYQDIKYREINIYSLLVLGIFSLAYLGLFIFKNNINLWVYYFTQIGITFVFLLIFYILGKISSFTYIGDGDLYTILALSFTNIFGVLYILFLFLLSLIITLLIPLSIFIYNLFLNNIPKYNFINSLFLMFLGYPLKISKLNSFFTPLETFDIKNNKLIRHARIKPIIEPKKEIIHIKKIAYIKKIKTIWVSPLIPFIFSIIIAYIFMLFIIFTDILPFISSFIINFI